MANSMDPDMYLHCFQLSLYMVSYCFKEWLHSISKVRAKLSYCSGTSNFHWTSTGTLWSFSCPWASIFFSISTPLAQCFIAQPKHIFWVLKRTMSIRLFFVHP